MKCSRCELDSTIKQGNQYLCDKHYRFGQMRSTAKRKGKTVPDHRVLEDIASKGLSCPDCKRTMNWRQKDGRDTVASLQHYRDGSFGIVCLSCNSRHGSMNGDSYCDMGTENKKCPKCAKIKPASEFFSDKSRAGVIRRKSYCAACSKDSLYLWRESNKDKYNEYQRIYRTRIKERGK